MMMEQADIHVEVRGQEVIVRLPGLGFEAVYYKPSGMAEMALRRRSATDDFRLLVRARQAVNNKARALGWIA